MCSASTFDGADFIDRLDMFGIRLGLDAVKSLLNKAGNPEKQLRFIHLAGTNGKGSTGAMLECALRHCGLKTGFYTSPHLIDIRERFRINGRAVSKALFDRCAEELAEISRGSNPSYFEFTTVLAAQIFLHEKCDIVIWETGMGGRLDATNAVTPIAAIITNIALDHQQHLGSTIAAIAGEKAGIIKPGVPVFCGRLEKEAEEVIRGKAAELDAPVTLPAEDVPEKDVVLKEHEKGFTQTFSYCGKSVTLGLPGYMQRENFRIVFHVLEYLAEQLNIDPEQALAGLDAVRWPARLDKVTDRLFVDGGHNPDGINAMIRSLKELLPQEKFTVIFGAFKDKDASLSIPLYRSAAKRFIMIPNRESGRACHSPEELIAMAERSGIPATAAVSGKEALDRALGEFPERILVSGSLFLAGEILDCCGMLDKALNID